MCQDPEDHLLPLHVRDCVDIVVLGSSGQHGQLTGQVVRQANVERGGTFAWGHRRSPSTLAVMTGLAQQLKPCRPVPQSLVFPYQQGGEWQRDLGAVVITTAVNMVNLQRSGGALAPRAGITIGREDPLSRVHRPSLRLLPAEALSTATPMHAGGRARTMPRNHSTTTWCVTSWKRMACRSWIVAAVVAHLRNDSPPVWRT